MDSNFPNYLYSNQKIDKEKWSRIHVAVWRGFYSIVEAMIKSGTPADSPYTGSKGYGFTPLHLAALKNQVKCAEVLLKHGASVSPKTGAVCDPIHIAVFKNHKEMTSLLLDHGADVDLRFNNSFFDLFHHELNVDLWQDHNLTLLHCSILLKFREITELLMKRGADVNLKTSFKKTTLMQAVEVTDVELVKDLLNRGVNVNDCDSSGQPVLHFTIYNSKRRRSIYCPEEYALKKEKLEIVKHLVDAGADINARYPDYIFRSAVIHYMVIYGFSSGVMYLLNNYDLNWKNIDDETVTSGELLYSSTSTTDYPSNYKSKLEQELAYIMFLIVQWAINRLLLGLPVDKSILFKQPIHNSSYQMQYSEKLKTYSKQTVEIVDCIKKTKIRGTNVTVYYLLTCTFKELVKLVNLRSVRSLEGISGDLNFKLNHPFIFMLVRRLNTANKKRLMMNKAAEIISNFLVGVLPYDCCRKIVEYLHDQELRNIILCCK